MVRRLIASVRPREARKIFQVWWRVDVSTIRVERRRWRRAVYALRSLAKSPSPCGPVWAISMVKNEEDIIGESVTNLLAQGVDYVLIADNQSTDATAQLAQGAGALVVERRAG